MVKVIFLSTFANRYLATETEGSPDTIENNFECEATNTTEFYRLHFPNN